MWRATLGDYRQNPWFIQLCQWLLQGSPDLLTLLTKNRSDHLPRCIRAGFYDYHFTTIAERRATGAWWKCDFIGDYLPSISLRE